LRGKAIVLAVDRVDVNFPEHRGCFYLWIIGGEAERHRRV
jgi:hypothetical protein